MFRLNPITRRRLAGFRKLKRAYVSFWLFVLVYAVGMLAGVLSNEKPLFVRFEDQNLFPVNPIGAFYPEDRFLKNGINTRPNYKKLDASPLFAGNPDHFMLWSLIPFGPNASTPPESIDIPNVILMKFQRAQEVATVNVREDGLIYRSATASFFFNGEEDSALRDRSLSEFWELTPSLLEAITARFENREMPTLSGAVASSSNMRAMLSVSAYTPRSRPPRSVRITFREIVSNDEAQVMQWSPGPTMRGSIADLWAALDVPQRNGLKAQITQRFDAPIPPAYVTIDDSRYEVKFEKEDIHFPFRPSAGHPLGLDSSGRDVLSRVLHALPIALNFGILLVLVTMVIGIFVGGVQGYFGGRIDLVGQRITEIWESLPFLFIMILLGSIYGRSFTLLLVVYGFFNWIGISYYMRGEFLKLRKQPFAEAAVCMGIGRWKVMWRHILPNALVPVITFFPFSLVGAIGSLAALDYLGFGLPAPTPSWGELLAQAQEFRFAWWLIAYPFIALFVVILLAVFIGEGVRSAFDPRTNTKME
jgi:microcin C transport system permease protein